MNCLSHCCVRRVSLTEQKHLDSCSTFHKAVMTSRAFPSHFVSWSKGWILPKPLHPMWNGGPRGKGCCSLEVFSWTLCIITNEKGAQCLKMLNLFIRAPLLTRDDDRCYFPGRCGVSETTLRRSRQSSATTFPHDSLFTKGDDSAKTVPVRCCF